MMRTKKEILGSGYMRTKKEILENAYNSQGIKDEQLIEVLCDIRDLLKRRDDE